MREQFYLKRGDTSPSIRYALRPPVNLAGAAARFMMRVRSGGAVTTNAAATIIDAAGGVVQYDWQAADTAAAGIYAAEFEITYPDGRIETFPNGGFIEVLIRPDIADAPAGLPSAPTITTAGSLSPASGPVGTVFTLIAPVASGSPAPSVTLTALTQNGVDVLGSVSAGTFTATAEGPLIATWTATNGVSPDAASQATASVVPPMTLAVADFSADRIVYDSGGHLGQNAAPVRLSGAGTAGQVVQARAVSLDDGGATTTAWVDIATISGGGAWSGTLNVPRSSSWYRPEVRLKASQVTTDQGANRFGSGHVLAIWGQSEVANWTAGFYDASTPAVITDPEAVQIYHGATGSPARVFISDTTPLTAACAGLAAELIAARPGEKFAVILQAVAGTDPRALVNDSDTSRNWSDDRALHDLATADGRQVGMAGMSWFASPGSLGASYGEALFPLFSKKTLAGADVTIPGTISYAGGGYDADHWFGELYDYAHTRWVAYGPHRFDITTDMLDATHDSGGAVHVGMQNKQAARLSWRALADDAGATMFLPMGFDPITYSNGRDDGAGGWTDVTHPSGWTNDGAALFARQTVLAMLRAGGLVSWAVPEFDGCLWESSGAYVEVWSSAGQVTTTRRARAEAALPATWPHWTEVVGFQVNGVPVTSAVVQGSGRVRITKPGGGAFVASDTLTFGDGGATGALKFPEDLQNALWKNLPIVDGIPVRPLPDPAVLANTLPGAPNFVTVAGQSTRFLDTANWPTSGGKFTFAYDGTILALTEQSYLCDMQNTHVRLSVAVDGRVFLAVRDSASTQILGSTQVGTVAIGARFEIIVAIDLVALTVWVTLNGTTTSYTLAANSGILASTGRKLNLLSAASGTSGFVIARTYSAEVWLDCAASGGRPADDTNLRANGRVTGPAAAANSHPWKTGGDTT